MPHDDAEAKDLLSRRAEKERPNTGTRAQAAHELITALLNLNLTAGFKVQSMPSMSTQGMRASALMEFEQRDVIVSAKNDGQIVIWRAADQQNKTPVDLDLDLVTKSLVGKQEDAFRTPVPGEPKHQRSALAVVVEQALQVMFK
jgi:hypothetical protein